MMRKLSLTILVAVCLVAQSGCGIVAHQAHRAKNLLLSPLRAAGAGLSVEASSESSVNFVEGPGRPSYPVSG